VTGCNSGSLSCTFTTNNTYASTTSNGITFPSNTPLAIYSASVTCSQNSASTTLDFYYSVVYGTNLLSAPSDAVLVVPDCIPSLVNSSFVNFKDDGGINSSMIIISPFASNFGDNLVTTNPKSWMSAGTFTMNDIESGLIYIQPALIADVLSSRTVSISLQAQDPTANLLITTAQFQIQWSYCPAIYPSTVITTSDTATPIVIRGSMLNITESHGLSVWDISWTISSLTGGRIEWYCPDSGCSGPGWKPLTLPARIQHVKP
jgi:hypothetical protein